MKKKKKYLTNKVERNREIKKRGGGGERAIQ